MSHKIGSMQEVHVLEKALALPTSNSSGNKAYYERLACTVISRYKMCNILSLIASV